MFKLLGGILGWVFKNLSLLIGIVEAVIKVLGGIFSLTPTKKDDVVLAIVDKVFSWIKKVLYTISDKLAGKPANIPN